MGRADEGPDPGDPVTGQGLSVKEALDSARAWIFDFDGTLVDSNPIKRRAFEICLEDLPRGRKEALVFCFANPHITRGEKFRHVYEKILGEPYTPQVERELHRRYEEATTRQVTEAPSIPGAEAFLAAGRSKHLCGILSTTPHEILTRILEQRGWGGRFDVVRGAPVLKGPWLKSFQAERGLRPEELLYFGDQPEDAQAAKSADCLFIGLRNPLLRGRGIAFWDDFEEVRSLWPGR